jgi:hypothetical protein
VASARTAGEDAPDMTTAAGARGVGRGDNGGSTDGLDSGGEEDSLQWVPLICRPGFESPAGVGSDFGPLDFADRFLN